MLHRNFVFDEVLAINLKRRPDRWKQLNKDMNAVGIFPRRVDAVDGRMLTRESVKHETSIWANQFLPKPAIGCAKSHRRAWKHIVRQGLKSALILEDDAYPEPRFTENLTQFWQDIPEDWDLVYLGGYPLADMAGFRASKHISGNVIVPYHTTGTHAYAVTQLGAQKLLKMTELIDNHLDWQMSHIIRSCPEFKAYAFYPQLIQQHLTDSDNQARSLISGNFLRFGPFGLNHLLDVSPISIFEVDITVGRVLSVAAVGYITHRVLQKV